MKTVFRADASLQMGTGHIMRCLTLADALAAKGAECVFICREHEGNLIEFIRNKGYRTHALPLRDEINTDPAAPADDATPPTLAHRHWLGATQKQDIEACTTILASELPDWLIVDHYALDATWEGALALHYRKLMVIDDLADRHHVCNLLLDQTFGRDAADYRPLVPTDCRLLCGAEYALLRPEFAALRPYSLQRRAQPVLRELLITMGGVDKDNATEQVLQALHICTLPADCRITVVMGSTAPWLNEVRTQTQDMPWPTRVLVGVSDMAQLMADSDLAIGASGATSWERCCLGLPSIAVALADNQRLIISQLEDSGAIKAIYARKDQLADDLCKEIINLSEATTLSHMSKQAASITMGKGAAFIEGLIYEQ